MSYTKIMQVSNRCNSIFVRWNNSLQLPLYFTLHIIQIYFFCSYRSNRTCELFPYICMLFYGSCSSILLTVNIAVNNFLVSTSVCPLLFRLCSKVSPRKFTVHLAAIVFIEKVSVWVLSLFIKFLFALNLPLLQHPMIM